MKQCNNLIALVLVSTLLLAMAGYGAESAASRDKKEGDLESASATPKLTRENLSAHGFKQSEKNEDSFVAEHARLGDVESALGFQITSLRPTVSQDMNSDSRYGLVEGKQVLVISEVRDEKGRIVRKSLDKPDAVCTVYAWVKKYVPPKPPLRSDSTPRVQVKSVTVPRDRAKPLQVTFELAADGKTPVGLIQDQFHVYVIQGDSQAFTGTVQFPAHSVHRVLVKPESPITYTVSVPDEPTILEGGWKGLDPGKYTLQVIIEGGGLWKGMGFDYLWLEGEPHGQKVESKKYEFTVPKD